MSVCVSVCECMSLCVNVSIYVYLCECLCLFVYVCVVSRLSCLYYAYMHYSITLEVLIFASTKMQISKVSPELIFANFANVVQIAKINSCENKFSQKLVLAKISTFKETSYSIYMFVYVERAVKQQATLESCDFRRNFLKFSDGLVAFDGELEDQ